MNDRHPRNPCPGGGEYPPINFEKISSEIADKDGTGSQKKLFIIYFTRALNAICRFEQKFENGVGSLFRKMSLTRQSDYMSSPPPPPEDFLLDISNFPNL
jgi:hypothetical protein